MGLHYLSHTGNGPARAYSCDKSVRCTVEIPDYFGRRGLPVDLRVCAVFKLLGHERAGAFPMNFEGFFDGPLYSFFAFGENKLCPIRLQELPPFCRHRIRHSKYKPVSFDGGYHCKADSRIATCWFDDSSSWLQISIPLCCFNHRICDPVLDRSARVASFKFCPDLGALKPGQAIDPHKWRVPYLAENAHISFHI